MQTIYPDGPNGASVQVYCTGIYHPNLQPSNKADWHVLASIVNGTFNVTLDSLLNNVPTMSANGANQWFYSRDLKTYSSEIFVSNEYGQSHVFKTEEFGGQLILDGPNFVSSTLHPGVGVVSGNNVPTVYHFQVEYACDSFQPSCFFTDCNDPCGQSNIACCASGSYSSGQKLTIWDWDGHVERQYAQTNPNFHAAFGQSNQTRHRWAAQGVIAAFR